MALKRIAESRSGFVSRGDDSGTHTKEQDLWKETGIALEIKKTEIVKKGKKRRLSFQHPGGLGDWYLSIGQGMGKTLTYAEEKQAYTLADRGTYLKYKFGRKQGLDLEILCEGDPKLYNPYGIIPINPKKFPHVTYEGAERLARWPNIWMPKPPSRSSTIRFFHGRRMTCVVRRRTVRGWLMMWSASV